MEKSNDKFKNLRNQSEGSLFYVRHPCDFNRFISSLQPNVHGRSGV